MKTNLELRPLRVEDESSFMGAVEEFARENPPWQFALGFDGIIGFAVYVKRLDGWSRGLDLPSGFVPSTYYVGVVGEMIVGRLSLRHCLNEYLRRIGGHIGYGVRPSQRRRGYAAEMLRQALPMAAKFGIDRALITCDVDNVGSRKVIEGCGGVLEGVTRYSELRVQKLRYWVNTAPR